MPAGPRIVVLLAAIMVAIAGCGQRGASGGAVTGDAQPPPPAPVPLDTKLGGTPDEIAVLSGVIRGFPVELSSINVGAPPAGGFAEQSPDDARWLYESRPAGEAAFAAAWSRWQALVVAGAYYDACAGGAVKCPSGYSWTSDQGNQAGDGASALDDDFDGRETQVAPSQLQQLAMKDGARFHLTNVSVQVDQAAGPVITITGTAADARTFLDAYTANRTLLGGELVSVLLAVYDGNGSPAFIVGTDTHVTAGVFWATPQFYPESMGALVPASG
jgi:hypothetical protein